MPLRLFFDRYSLEATRCENAAFFIFGDNFQRYGRAGQAVIRDCANAIGVATKLAPSMDQSAFLTNAHLKQFEKELLLLHARIEPLLRKGATVYWPADGVGTGLAALSAHAPDLAEKLNRYASGMFRKYGDEKYFSVIVAGGRDFGTEIDPATGRKRESSADLELFEEKMSELRTDALERGLKVEVIHGAARGADTLGANWAKAQGYQVSARPADWDRHGKRAGYVRNSEMARALCARRDQASATVALIAFPGGVGTRMMVEIARKQGIYTHVVQRAKALEAAQLPLSLDGSDGP